MEIRELPREEWPAQLLELPQVPKQLWVRGTMPEPGTKLLAVVGSRAMTQYGREACEKLISGLAGYPVSIVSGLALGTSMVFGIDVTLLIGALTIGIPSFFLALAQIVFGHP